MTVENMMSDGKGLWAQWFSGKKLERGHFSLASLKSADVDDDD